MFSYYIWNRIISRLNIKNKKLFFFRIKLHTENNLCHACLLEFDDDATCLFILVAV